MANLWVECNSRMNDNNKNSVDDIQWQQNSERKHTDSNTQNMFTYIWVETSSSMNYTAGVVGANTTQQKDNETQRMKTLNKTKTHKHVYIPMSRN
jgi:hypothetical protein